MRRRGQRERERESKLWRRRGRETLDKRGEENYGLRFSTDMKGKEVKEKRERERRWKMKTKNT